MSASRKTSSFTPPTNPPAPATDTTTNTDGKQKCSIALKPEECEAAKHSSDEYIPLPISISATDLDYVTTIARSTFAELVQVRRRDNKQLLVVKAFSHNSWRSEYLCGAELRVMQTIHSPWFLHFYGYLQDVQEDFLIFEYLPQGNLLQMVGNRQLSERLLKFYTAEMFMAVDSLHQHGIMHRNIQLSNFLVHQSGHLRLSGFGMSYQFGEKSSCKEHKVKDSGSNKSGSKTSVFKKAKLKLHRVTNPVFASTEMTVPVSEQQFEGERSQSISDCSTAYMAPEVLRLVLPKTYFGLLKRKIGYSFLCDYWSLGVAVYRMAYGRLPFIADDKGGVLDKVLDHRKSLSFPLISESMVTIQLLRDLLQKESLRLGRQRGFDEVREHAFFSGVKWEELGRGQIDIPASQNDLHNYFSVLSTTRLEPSLESGSPSVHSNSSDEEFVETSVNTEATFHLPNVDFQMPLITDPTVCKLDHSSARDSRSSRNSRVSDKAGNGMEERTCTTSFSDGQSGKDALLPKIHGLSRNSRHTLDVDSNYLERLMTWFSSSTPGGSLSCTSQESSNLKGNEDGKSPDTSNSD